MVFGVETGKEVGRRGQIRIEFVEEQCLKFGVKELWRNSKGWCCRSCCRWASRVSMPRYYFHRWNGTNVDKGWCDLPIIQRGVVYNPPTHSYLDTELLDHLESTLEVHLATPPTADVIIGGHFNSLRSLRLRSVRASWRSSMWPPEARTSCWWPQPTPYTKWRLSSASRLWLGAGLQKKDIFCSFSKLSIFDWFLSLASIIDWLSFCLIVLTCKGVDEPL